MQCSVYLLYRDLFIVLFSLIYISFQCILSYSILLYYVITLICVAALYFNLSRSNIIIVFFCIVSDYIYVSKSKIF